MRGEVEKLCGLVKKLEFKCLLLFLCPVDIGLGVEQTYTSFTSVPLQEIEVSSLSSLGFKHGNLMVLMPQSHQNLCMVTTVKLLGIMLRNAQ